MRKKLIKLRSYWLRTNFAILDEGRGADGDMEAAFCYLVNLYNLEDRDIRFDYRLSSLRAKKKWKLIYVDFLIISEI